MTEAKGMLARMCEAGTHEQLIDWHDCERLVLADWLEEQDDSRAAVLRAMTPPDSNVLRIPFMSVGASVHRVDAVQRYRPPAAPRGMLLELWHPYGVRLSVWHFDPASAIRWTSSPGSRPYVCDRRGGMWLSAGLNRDSELEVVIAGWTSAKRMFGVVTYDMARSIRLAYQWPIQQLLPEIGQPVLLPMPWQKLYFDQPDYFGQAMLDPDSLITPLVISDGPSNRV